MTSLIVVHHRCFTDPVGQQQDSCDHGRAYQNPDHSSSRGGDGVAPTCLRWRCLELAGAFAGGAPGPRDCFLPLRPLRQRNCRRLERGTNPVGGSFTSEATT